MKNKFNFTILGKIILSFGILTSVVIITNLLTFSKFEQNLAANKRISYLYAPSIEYLNDIIFMVVKSDELLKKSIFIDKSIDSKSRKDLDSLHTIIFPYLKNRIIRYVEDWSKEEQNQYYGITTSLDSLFLNHDLILDDLIDFDSYQNTELMFEITMKVTENGEIVRQTDRVIHNLDSLLTIQEKNMMNYNSEMEASFTGFRQFIYWMAAILIISMILIGIMISRTLIVPIKKINNVIRLMGNGLQPDVNIEKRTDEIGEMADSLKHLIAGLKATSKFALKIGESNFKARYKPLSEQDVLGNSLILMRENLIKANREAELRKIENFQRNWTSQGLAEFNDLIRDVSKDLVELSQSVISKLVEYLEASLGGLFIVNDDNKDDIFLELIAFYAYDRQKFIKKRIEIGETLVGQCYQEKEKIYITDVPEDYVKITSGLGSDKPKNVLIMPLTINEKIYGIVEIASFNDIEKYQIEFVEKIGESIATAISSVKINLRTTALLTESNEKSKSLEKQEALSRQNIAEIEANLMLAKEELIVEQRKVNILKNEKDTITSEFEKTIQKHNEKDKEFKNKLTNIQHIIDNAFPYYELTINDEYSYVNNKYLDLINFDRNEILGKKHNALVSKDFINSGNYKKIWDKLKQGRTASLSVQYLIDGKSRILNEKFIPVLNDKEQMIKVGVFCNQ